jgi:hypothetical protein
MGCHGLAQRGYAAAGEDVGACVAVGVAVVFVDRFASVRRAIATLREAMAPGSWRRRIAA